MCGSGTFAPGVFLIECGLIEGKEPVTEITLEMVAGLMRLRAEVEDGRVVRVLTTTEPGFHLKSTEIELPSYGRLPIDISYCLNYICLGFRVTRCGNAEFGQDFVRMGTKSRGGATYRCRCFGELRWVSRLPQHARNGV